jgi:hypothetical protein
MSKQSGASLDVVFLVLDYLIFDMLQTSGVEIYRKIV